MSPVAATNRVRVGVVRESSFGVIPTNPVFQNLRYTSSGLMGAPQTIVSNEIVSDRQVSDLVMVGKDIGGELAVEWMAGAHDLLIEAALFGNWTKLSERFNSPTAGGITAVAATTYTCAASGAATGLGAFAQNDLIRATGFTNGANNKTFVAAAATSATSIVHSGGVVETPPAAARVKKIGVAGASADIVAAISPNRLTSSALNFSTAGIVVGMWIMVGSDTAAGNKFATAANKGWVRVSAVSANSLTLDIVPTGWAADSGTGKTIWLQWGDYVRNGVTQFSHTLEQAYLDNGQYQYFSGMVANGMSMEVDAKQLVKGQFTFLGATSKAVSVAEAGATNWDWNPVTGVLNAAASVGRLSENGTPIVGPNFVLGVKLGLNNNLRAQEAVGTIGAVGVGAGRAEVSGSIMTYFGDVTLLQKVLNNTLTSLDFNLKDSDGSTVLVDLPSIKLSTGTAPVPGINQDVQVECGFQALKHATLGYTLHFQKVEGLS